MKITKTITGKFEPEYSATTKDFLTYLIAKDFDFSYKTKETTGEEAVTVKFDSDEDYDEAVAKIEHLEQENNPQLSLDLDGNPQKDDEKKIA